MSNTSDSGSKGLGVIGVTFVVFVILKLTGNLDWSWWLVTSPLWGSFALAVLVGAVKGVAEVVDEEKGRKRR